MRRTKDEIKASRKIEDLLLLASDFFAGLWEPASLSCFLIKFAKRLSQGLC